MRQLRRRRLDDDVLEMPEAAVVGEALARRPRPRHHRNGLLETRLGFFRRDRKTLELAVPVAFADAEIETAAGDQIKRRRLLGEQHRIVPWQHDDRRAEPQRRGAHGGRHQQHQGRRHLVPAGEMMLDQKARLKAERLGLDVEIEIIAKPLPGFRRQIVAVALRRAEQAKFHHEYLWQEKRPCALGVAVTILIAGWGSATSLDLETPAMDDYPAKLTEVFCLPR